MHSSRFSINHSTNSSTVIPTLTWLDPFREFLFDRPTSCSDHKGTYWVIVLRRSSIAFPLIQTPKPRNPFAVFEKNKQLQSSAHVARAINHGKQQECGQRLVRKRKHPIRLFQGCSTYPLTGNALPGRW